MRRGEQGITRLALASAALAAACAAGGAVDPQPGAVPLAFERVLARASSGLSQPLREVIRDEATWAEVWTRIHAPEEPRPSLPPFDFSREMLIVAATGTRASAGFGISVQSVAIRDGRLEVAVVESCPPPGAMVAMALTQPVEVVRLERRAEALVFVEAKDPSCR